MNIERPYRIAVIDDDPVLLDIMERVLRRVPNVIIRSFNSPKQALKAIRDEKIHIVFVDINMPEMFGDDVLKECIAMKQGIQVYIVTGSDSVLLADRCLNSGARGILFKPFDHQELIASVTEAIQFLDKWNRLVSKTQKKAG